MKIIVLLFLFISSIFASIGQVTSLKGSATAVRALETLTVTAGFQLEEKDIINTADKSKVQVIFNDGTTITIGKKSQMDIAEYLFDEATPKNSKTNLKFLKGAFKSITGKIGKAVPGKFKLATKTASIGIRGTVVLADQENVAFTEGQGTVTSGGETVDIQAGQLTETKSGEGPTPPGPIPKSFMQKMESTLDEKTEVKPLKAEAKKEKSDKKEKKEKADKKEKKSDDKADKKEEKKEEKAEKKVADKTEDKKTEEKKTQKSQSSVTEAKDDEEGGEPTLKATTTKSDSKTEETPKQESTTPETKSQISVTNAPEDDGANDVPVQAPVPIEAPKSVEIPTTEVEAPIVDVPVVDAPEIDLDAIKDAANDAAKTATDVVTEIVQEKETTKVVEESKTVLKVTDVASTFLDSLSDDLTTEPSESNLGSDAYLSYGYWESADGQESGTYATGIITPTEIVQELISLPEQVMSYSGSVAAIVTDLDGQTSHATGSVNINIDFANSDMSGNINVSDWSASINSGDITKDGFNSSDITGSVDGISDVTGNINGDFYGTSAQAIGGEFNLESPTNGSVAGSFGSVTESLGVK